MEGKCFLPMMRAMDLSPLGGRSLMGSLQYPACPMKIVMPRPLTHFGELLGPKGPGLRSEFVQMEPCV
jgi:hypothetical protein